MYSFRPKVLSLMLSALIFLPSAGLAGPAADLLPVRVLLEHGEAVAPVANAAFLPPPDAKPAAPLVGTLEVLQAVLATQPALSQPVVGGRDARLFPAIALKLFTVGELLVPVARGQMIREAVPGPVPSYWRVIAQFGRVWHEQADGDWNRAALPLMLVNDTENHAHQGLATFLYKEGAVSDLRLQFVQQSGPYLLKPHFIAWGSARTRWVPGGVEQLQTQRLAARRELAERLPARPWDELVGSLPAGTLDGFGGPLRPEWRVATALVRDGVLYYQPSSTPYGPYPYPLEMRFGVRSVMKSIGAPLALLRLAEVYGPWVLALHVGDYVPGLDPKYHRVRFVDAAGMASGMGGAGSLRTHPNDFWDGNLSGEYDKWYTAPSNAQKLAQIAVDVNPYPWEPGTVARYSDRDYYLLGVAVDAFLKSVRGPEADVWEMLQQEVLQPIGIAHAPAVRTREPGGGDGRVWFNAGYYPTLDDLAKIARLYQRLGEHRGRQLLHRQLTADLMSARGALAKDGAASPAPASSSAADAEPGELYMLGFHYTPYRSTRDHRLHYVPRMNGAGENEVMLYPNGLVSIVAGKARSWPEAAEALSDEGPATIRAAERVAPF